MSIKMKKQKTGLTKYIQYSCTVITEGKETAFFKSIPVFIKDPLPETVSINATLRAVERIIPRRMVSNIEMVYVGQFKDFAERDINAMYEGGTLYISNEQDDEEDMVDDLVHEISHAVEEQYGMQIYGDGELHIEFLKKRKKLYQLLKAYDYPVEYKDFMNSEYDKEFDKLLYKEIGYDKLEHFTMGLFPSNYAVTSLREYFGIGFEHYYLKNRRELGIMSPVLFQKLEEINEEEE